MTISFNQLDNSAFLEHYGILGMKWGIRKDGKPQGYSSAKKRISTTADKIATKVTRLNKSERVQKQKIKAERRKIVAKRSILSDEELNKQLDRLKKEKQLKDLTNSEVDSGRTQAKQVLNSAGKKIVISLATAGGAAVVTYLGTKIAKGESNLNTPKVLSDAYKLATKTK